MVPGCQGGQGPAYSPQAELLLKHSRTVTLASACLSPGFKICCKTGLVPSKATNPSANQLQWVFQLRSLWASGNSWVFSHHEPVSIQIPTGHAEAGQPVAYHAWAPHVGGSMVYYEKGGQYPGLRAEGIQGLCAHPLKPQNCAHRL